MRLFRKTTRRTLVLLACVTIGVLAAAVWVWPKASLGVNEAKQSWNDAQTISQVAAGDSQVAVADRLAAAGLTLPATSNGMSLLQDVVQSSKNTGLLVSSGDIASVPLTVSTQAGPVVVDTYTVSLSLSGSSNQVAEFIESMSQSTPLIALTSASIRPEGENLNAELGFTAYSLKTLPSQSTAADTDPALEGSADA